MKIINEGLITAVSQPIRRKSEIKLRFLYGMHKALD
jgi:hypothetical protein